MGSTFHMLYLKYNRPLVSTAFTAIMIWKTIAFTFYALCGAPVAQWVKRWPTDLADRVRS